MRIIKSTPNESGAYPPIQTWGGDVPPDGYSQVSVGVALSCGGFGTLTGIGNVVTAFIPDETAWAAWKAANPEPTAEPSAEEQNRADIDYIAIMTGVDL